MFDLNDAIVTNTHQNTLDFDAPVTTMTPFTGPQQSDSTVVVWEADDGAGSGVSRSAVFVSTNDGPFEWVGNAVVNQFRVSTPTAGNYSFYALAIDSVGNAESTRPEPSTVEVTSVGVEEIELLTFELRPAYPNPFAQSAVITYSLAQSDIAILTVYDILGRRVTVLVDRHHEPGNHRLIWRPQSLANGLYFVRLIQGTDRSTIPIVLVD